MPWLDDPLTTALALPAFAVPLFVLVSAALEYIIPPYWGDMFVLLGFFLSGHGVASPELIFAAAFLGSLLGAAVAFLLGRRFGLRIMRWVTIRRRPGSRDRLRDLLTRFGEKLLLVNRFVPVIRGLLLYGAGALEMRLGRAMIYSSVSNAAWLGLLMGVGLYTAGTWEEIVAQFQSTSRVLGLSAALVVTLWAAAWWRWQRGDDAVEST